MQYLLSSFLFNKRSIHVEFIPECTVPSGNEVEPPQMIKLKSLSSLSLEQYLERYLPSESEIPFF